MNRYLISFLLLLFFNRCTVGSESQQADPSHVKNIVHYNIIIVPDLSNRLNRQPTLPDTGIVNGLLHQIYPTIARLGREAQQKDRYSVILSSTRLGTRLDAMPSKMNIDLSAFRNNQMDRIQYLTGQHKNRDLQRDIAAFSGEFARIETLARQQTDGADIWSLLHNGIGRNLAINPEAPFTFNKQPYRNVHRNILILLTDGYIEAGLSPAQGCEGRQCRYLSASLINRFRQAFNSRANKADLMQDFFERNQYGIISAQNPDLTNFEVLVLEVDDRSLTPTGNAMVAPTDYEIIRLFWTNWMKQSGVSHFDMHPVARNAQEAWDHIFSFISQPASPAR